MPCGASALASDWLSAFKPALLAAYAGAPGPTRNPPLDDGVAAALHGLPGRFRCRPVGVVMQHDRDATHCQRLADRCAHAARGPGYEYVSHASRLRCVIPRTDAGAGRPPRCEYAASLGAAAMVCHARDEVIAWPLVDRAHRPHHTIRGHRPSPRTGPGPGLPQACHR